MLQDDFKYFCFSGTIFPRGPSHWFVSDWDQRRVVTVTYEAEEEDGNVAMDHYSRYGSELSRDVHRIYISPAGELISTHSDPDDDELRCVHYPFLHECSLPEGIQTVRRDKLEELDRLGPDTDLVTYSSGGSARKVVFKYYWHWQMANKVWTEMNLWMRLPRHPNIVPFDRVVVDELEGRVVGFTSEYISGGTLEENKTRVFKLEWLQQLIGVVDDMNLRWGIKHQDVAPRNLLVDESTDSLMLFDFDHSARIGHASREESENDSEKRNDVKGVIFTAYEIITQDDNLRIERDCEQSFGDLRMEWVKHPEVKLDHPVESYQLILRQWETRRAGRPDAARPDHVAEPINWPPRPKVPTETTSHYRYTGPPIPMNPPPLPQGPRRPRSPSEGAPPPPNKRYDDRVPLPTDGELVYQTREIWDERRQEKLAKGDKVLNWERPPQRLINNGLRVLSTGEVIDC